MNFTMTLVHCRMLVSRLPLSSECTADSVCIVVPYTKYAQAKTGWKKKNSKCMHARTHMHAHTCTHAHTHIIHCTYTHTYTTAYR